MFGRAKPSQDTPDEAFDKAAAAMREFGLTAAGRIISEVRTNPATDIRAWHEKALEHVVQSTPAEVPRFMLRQLLEIVDTTIKTALAEKGITYADGPAP